MVDAQGVVLLDAVGDLSVAADEGGARAAETSAASGEGAIRR